MKTETSNWPSIRPPLSWPTAILVLGIGCWLMAVCWHEWLCDPALAACFDCEAGRRWLIRRLGGKFISQPVPFTARIPFENVLFSQIVFTLLWWVGGAIGLSRPLNVSFARSLLIWGGYSSLWWLLAGSWTILRLAASVLGLQSVASALSSFPEMWLSFASAGWFSTLYCILAPGDQARQSSEVSPNSPIRGDHRQESSISLRIPFTIWVGIVVYTLVFGGMNSLLYANLLIPHGDSAMYEEHLWNLLHGKGFRSFIDQGLFLGEHIQVIHVGLLPIYVLWPSHVCLEWLQSFGLALGAIPVYRMAVRQTGHSSHGICLALAYLMFVPMQRLDISIDFKTFRPESFGIPLLLAALDGFDQRGFRSSWPWMLAALMVKEEYALLLGPLGAWWCVTGWFAKPQADRSWKNCLPGILLTVGSAAYLWLAVKVVIPYFRHGNEVHYARYFQKFGNSINEILLNLITQPGLLMGELITVENFLFAAALTFSLALLPLLSPGRLAVGLPLFVALALNDIARNTQHHFHAPLVAIVFWSAAHGLRNIASLTQRFQTGLAHYSIFRNGCLNFVAVMTLCASSGYQFWHSQSPFGLPFWDPTSSAHWSSKYLLTERSVMFAKVVDRIPSSSHVASTDFIHPRFNHFARSYDYSGYRPVPPEDTEYLVIDVHGPYSRIKTPQDVPLYRVHPEDWEMLPDDTQGYFYIFRRIRRTVAFHAKSNELSGHLGHDGLDRSSRLASSSDSHLEEGAKFKSSELHPAVR